MSSPPQQSAPSPTSIGPQRDEIIAALQRRQSEVTSHEIREIQHEQEHDTRQAFRRMIDPGIMRGTHKDTAFASMKALLYWIIVLLKLAENLISEPDNVKYQRFKPTNTTIKTNLIDVKKGALEYAVAMGFRADVHDFQPYYVFNQSCMKDLRIGAAVLRDTLTLETEREERAQRLKREENSIKQMQSQQACCYLIFNGREDLINFCFHNQIKLAFQDDRKRRALHDKLEKERRDARLTNPAAPASTSSNLSTSELNAPTSPGRRLSDPPPYDSEHETD